MKVEKPATIFLPPVLISKLIQEKKEMEGVEYTCPCTTTQCSDFQTSLGENANNGKKKKKRTHTQKNFTVTRPKSPRENFVDIYLEILLCPLSCTLSPILNLTVKNREVSRGRRKSGS